MNERVWCGDDGERFFMGLGRDGTTRMKQCGRVRVACALVLRMHACFLPRLQPTWFRWELVGFLTVWVGLHVLGTCVQCFLAPSAQFSTVPVRGDIPSS